VDHLPQNDVLNAGLLSQASSALAYISMDHGTVLSTSAIGRQSICFTAWTSWKHGLFIGDIGYVPDITCGVWPACM